MKKKEISGLNEKKQNKYISSIFFTISFFLPFAFYNFTLYRDIIFFDAGELVLASYIFGITHPTGYPLYILLTYPFVHIFSNPVCGSSLFSALCLCLSCIFLFRVSENLIDLDLPVYVKRLIGLSFVFFFSSNLLIWHWSIQPEVYSFHILLSSITFYFFLKSKENPSKYYLFFLFLALSLSHHRISIYYLPVFLIGIVLRKNLKKILNFKNFLFFILGFLPYLFMFIQAKTQPLINWGNPSNLKNFFYHILGKQYMHIIKITPITKLHLKYLFTSILEDMLFPVVLFSLLGFIILILNKKWKIYLHLLFILSLSLLQVLFYEIGDIEPYFINFEFCLILFSLYFMAYFYKKFKWAIFIFLLIGILSFVINFKKVNGSNFYFPRNFLENTIFSLPENSILLTSQGAIFYFPSLYLQTMENKREDLIIIDTNLLRFSWYLNFLSRQYESFYLEFKEEFKEYKELLIDYEKDKKVPLSLLSKNYKNLLQRIIEKRLQENKQIFSTHEFVLKGYADMFFPVPCGILFEIKKEKRCYPCNFAEFETLMPASYPIKQKLVIKDLINLKKNFLEYRRKYEKDFCN